MASSEYRSLLVLAYDSGLQAREALAIARQLERAAKLRIHDAVFVTKDADGKTAVRETLDSSTADAALGSSVFGMLVGVLFGGPLGGLLGGAITAGTGALMARLIDVGIADEVVRELRHIIAPGDTALALQVSEVEPHAVLAELCRYADARIVQSTIPGDVDVAVQQMLGTHTAARAA